MSFAERNSSLLHQLEAAVRSHTPRVLPGNRAEAGVLVALTDEPDDPHLILTRRTVHMNAHAGEVAFPGGKRDPGDADLAATALREAQEEIDLDPALVRLVGPLDQVLSKHGLRVEPWLGIVPPDVRLRANPAELESLFRVPLRFFLEDRRSHTDRLGGPGKSLYVPAYRYNGYLIWGLTAYVIVELLNNCLNAGIPMRPRPQ